MASPFVGSRYFVIAAVVAALLVVGGAVSYRAASRAFPLTDDACDPIAVEGVPMAAERSDERVSGSERRVTYSLPASSLQGGSARLCASVGEIVVGPAAGDAARLVFTIRGPERAVDATVVDAAFATSGDGLAVGAWQETAAQIGTMFSRRGVDVTIELLLPETGAYDLAATIDVGDARASGLMVRELSLASDVGDVVATRLDLSGNATVATDVGRVILDLASVQGGRIEATGDVADLEVRLPSRADVGYDVHAQTGVGDVDVGIGPTERNDRDMDPAGGSVDARSEGYASKPTQVVVHATADVGDVIVKSASS